MKPKRPTETDLLTIVQNGFNAQLPMDRAVQGPDAALASKPQSGGIDPAALVPMARITLTVPEELRYRLKLVLMNQRRTGRSRMTQDEFCAKAIGALLDLEEGPPVPTMLRQKVFTRLSYGGQGRNWNDEGSQFGKWGGPAVSPKAAAFHRRIQASNTGRG